MSVNKVRSKGQVTIPSEIREQAQIEEGTILDFVVTDAGILMRPKLVVDAEDAWFWSKAWQEGEREAEAEMTKPGKAQTHGEFMEALNKR